MTTRTGRVMGVSGNLVSVEFDAAVRQNEVAYVLLDELRLIAEVIRVRGRYADMQVFESTAGIKVGDPVEFVDELLSVELGPGLLSRVFDGLQNPLNVIAEQHGFFLPRGVQAEALPRDQLWEFTPRVASGDRVRAGDTLGVVPEGIFEHRILVPFGLVGTAEVAEVAGHGEYTITDRIAVLHTAGGHDLEVAMLQRWPVKRPIRCYAERLRPTEQLVTKMRILDTFFPVAKGGTYCIPGPFGAGKTVLQQLTSRHADVDVVVVAACGERAGEVVETLREFPELTDPRTGRSLMERTVIICNTSSMPVAAREASVYTAVTIAEYYRQMGLHVLLLADSTSRWAQALREMSGRLEEIPGEEAFPAYLESVIAAFYERAGVVRLNDGTIGARDHRRHRQPGRRQLRGAGDAVHAQGRRRLPRPLAPALGRAPLPGDRPAGQLEQVRERRPRARTDAGPPRAREGSRGPGDDEGGGGGGHGHGRLRRLPEGRVPGRGLPAAGRLRPGGRRLVGRAAAARVRRSWRASSAPRWTSPTRMRRARSSRRSRRRRGTGTGRRWRTRPSPPPRLASRPCSRRCAPMRRVYQQLAQIAGNVITVQATGVGNQELAGVEAPGFTSLAQVIRLEGDDVTMQVFAGTRGVPTDAEVRFLGRAMQMPFSEALLGRVFTGGGVPRDRGPAARRRPHPHRRSVGEPRAPRHPAHDDPHRASR